MTQPADKSPDSLTAQLARAIEDIYEIKNFRRNFSVESVRDNLISIEQALTSARDALGKQWIPISERVPLERGWYIVTFESGYVLSGYWNPSINDFNGRDVIAWMEFPEPYTSPADTKPGQREDEG